MQAYHFKDVLYHIDFEVKNTILFLSGCTSEEWGHIENDWRWGSKTVSSHLCECYNEDADTFVIAKRNSNLDLKSIQNEIKRAKNMGPQYLYNLRYSMFGSKEKNYQMSPLMYQHSWTTSPTNWLNATVILTVYLCSVCQVMCLLISHLFNSSIYAVFGKNGYITLTTSLQSSS